MTLKTLVQLAEVAAKVLGFVGACYCAKPFFNDFASRKLAEAVRRVKGVGAKATVFVETLKAHAQAQKDAARPEDNALMWRGMALIAAGFAIELVIGLLKLIGVVGD